MTAARRPRLDDIGVEYVVRQPVAMRRRALHQAVPMRLPGTIVDHDVYLLPRARWWHRMGVLALQTAAWATLVVTGVLCVVLTIAVAWGTWQACALLLRALIGVLR